MEIGTIAFLTSSHSPFDDRIFYHQAKSLSKNNQVVIVSSTENKTLTIGNISVLSEDRNSSGKKEKIEFFIRSLSQIDPELIICSEPLPIIAAWRYKKKFRKKAKVIYDVTEWYPSKKNLEGLSGIKKLSAFFRLLVFHIYALAHCDGFIFGEHYKSLPFRFLFPLRKWTIVSYYPDLNYINFQESNLRSGEICLGYTGRISIEKGIESFFNVAIALKAKNPELAVKLKIIGWFFNENDESIFRKLCSEAENIEIQLLDKQDFEHFSNELIETDVLFDLRKVDLENNHCLAIKVFYYAACGKPVIYSNLKAIEREIDVNKFGYFVNPNDSEQIAGLVIEYVKHLDLYQAHSRQARKLAETEYNWEKIEPLFLDFVNKFQS